MHALQRIALNVLLGSALLAVQAIPAGAYDVVPPSVPSFGYLVDEPLTGGFSTISSLVGGVPPVYNGKLLNGENRLCLSASDPHCEGMYSFVAELMLPPCANAESRMCIEGVEISTEGRDFVRAKVDHVVASASTLADTSTGLPAGGAVALWKAPSMTHLGGTDTYGVVVHAQYQQMLKVPGVQEASKLRLVSFSASVIPVVMTPGYGNVWEIREVPHAPGPYAGKYNVQTGPKEGSSGPYIQKQKCLWYELALCAQTSAFAENSNAAVTLRMNSDLTGWLFGRMKEVKVSVTPIDAKNNTMRIEGKPVDVPAALGFVPKAEVSKYPRVEAWQKLNYAPGDGYYEKALADPFSSWGSASSAGGFEPLSIFEEFLKPIPSQGERWLISAGATANGLVSTGGGCFASSTQLLGIVTTNAMVYSPGPPELKDSALIYKVGGLHTTANGDVFKGTYDLAMRSETARCLYNFTKAPIRAEVEVVSSDGSNQNVTTVIQNEKDGWFTLGAYNFTFSQPTIRIKLSQEKTVAPTPAATPTSAPSAPAGITPAGITPTTQAKTPAAPATANKAKTIIITCVKGKTTKKVVGANPACPAGYKKK
ncbi:MAG: hypothetical protein EBV30_03575 [Actinobacteria bacterium]|nr:hypothetical protein [Actinomycetota bacterium]